MFKDYVIYDNILDDAEKIVDIAKSSCYYSSDGRSIDGVNLILDDEYKPTGGWRGLRSRHLAIIDENIFENTYNEIFTKVFNLPGTWKYFIDTHFHLAPGYIEFDDHWWHIDRNSLFAGVIYLNKNAEDNGGTLIKDKDNNEISVDNKFNRLIMYKSNLSHRPMNCFGSNIDNARLTISFFIREINFSIQ